MKTPVSIARACVGAVVLTGAIAASGSGCDLAPDVGAPIAERCSDDDTDPATAVSFVRDIAPILVRDLAGCAPCHIPRADGDIGFHNGGLDVTNIAALNRGGFNSSRNVIVPGRPCDSVLYLKVSPGPPFAKRMPFDGPPYLTVIELALFHDWIAEGAKDE